jgi:hypothetical protein
VAGAHDHTIIDQETGLLHQPLTLTMSGFEPAFTTADFRTKPDGGYQNKGEYADELGALQLIRPTPIQRVVSHVRRQCLKLGRPLHCHTTTLRVATSQVAMLSHAAGGRAMGNRETLYSGVLRGRFGAAAKSESAASALLRRLRARLIDLEAVLLSPSRPGVLKRSDVSVTELFENEAAVHYADGIAHEHTRSGTVYAMKLEDGAPQRLPFGEVGEAKARGRNVSGKRRRY